MRNEKSQKTPFMKIRKVFRPKSLDEEGMKNFGLWFVMSVLSVVSSMVVLCACFQRLLVLSLGFYIPVCSTVCNYFSGCFLIYMFKHALVAR